MNLRTRSEWGSPVRAVLLPDSLLHRIWRGPRSGDQSGLLYTIKIGERHFPSVSILPVKFRTAGFAQSGLKADLSGLPTRPLVKPALGMPLTSRGLPSPFALSVVIANLRAQCRAR